MRNKNIIDALLCSINGLKVLFKEKSAKREIFLLIFSIFYCLLAKPEFIFVLLLLILPIVILGLEAINTAIEYVCNKITLVESDKIRKAKDLGSASIFLFLLVYFIIFFLSFYQIF